MSFSYSIKTELCKVKASGCCRHAEIYSMLLFSRAFFDNKIIFRTKNEQVANRFAHLLKVCFDIHSITKVNGTNNKVYVVTVNSEQSIKRLKNIFVKEDELINLKILNHACCVISFLRGAFLTCGSINDPDKGYHFEFAVRDNDLATEFAQFLFKQGAMPKLSIRKTNTMVYFNDSDSIEDMLTRIGATQYSLEIIGIKIIKDVRNKQNRINNFDTANISKTVDAAIKQTKAIDFLIEHNSLSMLPEELEEVALIRKNNPEASLNELCQICENRITKSGLNHRLKKIIDFADKLKQNIKE